MKASGQRIFLIVLTAGILIRLIQYFYSRSLWVDEAMLSLNIIQCGFRELMLPLKHEQVAPVLFLWIEKTSVLLFGNNEFSLRLFPLLCGITILPLVYDVTRRLTADSTTAIVVLVFFAFSRTFVFFSTETKQYCSDLLLSLLFLRLILSEHPRKHLFLFLLGFTGIVLSNVGIVIVTMYACWFFSEQVRERKIDWKNWLMLAVLAGWFMVCYRAFIKGHPTQSVMIEYWQGHFIPDHPLTLTFWKWLIRHFVVIYSTLLGFNEHFPASIRNFIGTAFLFAAVYGAVRYLRSVANRNLALLLSAPILIHLMLAALHLYPFSSRLVLYLSPFLLIPAAYGWVEIIRQFSPAKWPAIGAVVAYIVFIYYWMPIRQEEIKECIAYVNRHPHVPAGGYGAATKALEYYSDPTYSFCGNLGGDCRRFELFDKKESALNRMKDADSVFVIVSHNDDQIREILDLTPEAKQVYGTTGAAVLLLK